MSLDLQLFSTCQVRCSGSTPPGAVEGVEGRVHVQLLEYDTVCLSQHFDSDNVSEMLWGGWAENVWGRLRTVTGNTSITIHTRPFREGGVHSGNILCTF